MTRANFLVITKEGKFNFQSNSSAYPSYMMEAVIKFATSTASKNSVFKTPIGFHPSPETINLSEFIDDCGLTLGKIGNPTYYYEIDFVKQTVRVWNNKLRWINAPIDWRERGYNCWENKKGSYGWTEWVKNKLIYSKRFDELVVDVEEGEVILFKGVIEEAKKING